MSECQKFQHGQAKRSVSKTNETSKTSGYLKGLVFKGFSKGLQKC